MTARRKTGDVKETDVVVPTAVPCPAPEAEVTPEVVSPETSKIYKSQ
jgi:hypothetical protein